MANRLLTHLSHRAYMKLLLASSSPYRKKLLEDLGHEFETASPGIDEQIFKQNIADPRQLSEVLAYEKAKVIHQKFPNYIVIGSDQVCGMEGYIFDKPGTQEKAVEQLKEMRGRKHTLYTSVSVLSYQPSVLFTNETHLLMKNLSDNEIEEYVKKDNPIDCAGSYKIESFGRDLFEEIETTDETAIIGLPTLQLQQVLENLLKSATES